MDAVIFDFDGVIADTDEFYLKYLRDYYSKLGVILNDSDIMHVIGATFEERIDYLNEKYGTNVKKAEFTGASYEKMTIEMKKKVAPRKGFPEFLNKLRLNKTTLGVASSNSTENVTFYLRKFGIRDFFSEIVTLDDVDFAKPAPDVYLKAVSFLKKKPEKCIAIEDTYVGIESAKKAGLKAIAIPTQFTRNHDFSKADLVVDYYSDLTLKTLEGLVK